MLYTTKYAPQNSDQIFGQAKAVEELKGFIANHNKKLHADLMERFIYIISCT